MKLQDVDLLEFLPQYMRQDKTAQGFVYAINKEFKKIIDDIQTCFIYGRIEQLNDAFLDELAWQFNVPEYIPTLDIEIKRNIIKNCISTHRKRGTVAAVEKSIVDVFGNGYIEEWFDYDKSKPYYFKVHTSNVSVSDDMINEFTQILKSTQNLRSELQKVVVETSQRMSLYQGIYQSVIKTVYQSQ